MTSAIHLFLWKLRAQSRDYFTLDGAAPWPGCTAAVSVPQHHPGLRSCLTVSRRGKQNSNSKALVTSSKCLPYCFPEVTTTLQREQHFYVFICYSLKFLSITVYIQYYFVVCSFRCTAQWLITLQGVPSDISSTHLAPHIVITVLLTVFPMLYFTSCGYSVTTNLGFLTPSPFSHSPPTTYPLATISLLREQLLTDGL